MVMLPLYRFISKTIAPWFIQQTLAERIKKGKELPERIPERKGYSSRPRPEGSLIWIHSASVGEAQIALTLIKNITKLRPEIKFLVTSVTVTSGQMLVKQLPSQAIHQFIPFDVPQWVNKFLDTWKPNLAIWIESELWPNFIEAVHAHNIPLLLINGHLSDKSFKRWGFARGFIRPLLEKFSSLMVQSSEQVQRFKSLGGVNPIATGNLKFAAAPLKCDLKKLKEFKSIVGNRPFWVAASTHDGEEISIIKAHQRVKKSFNNILTVIVPRHPERGPTLKAMMKQYGLKVACRSTNDKLLNTDEIYLADTLGELGLFYNAANIVFVGGSLISIGGHNIIEPARLNCAILHGPHMHNARSVSVLFAKAQGSLEISDEQTLAEAIESLLRNESLRNTLAKNALRVAESEDQAMTRVIKTLNPFLKNL
ncbi:hypothetical protein GQ61_03275 [Candidatus Nucleicultrix amoebiphila FS5]|uniref:3-deoxy-D-manno-octulosonic acid transferase n=2 Tax=Candidatus Nucleicultrix TaxID=1509243 RepID=A0A1W6N3R7_9PROT|nr:hypothetical protein GQ61_03275 [Candidatus Nucleicultrix amoebiphila FS5]